MWTVYNPVEESARKIGDWSYTHFWGALRGMTTCGDSTVKAENLRQLS